jgi:hypothetical protein
VSKIALSGDPSGTGTFTLASPNSSTDRTLDLPDASGVIDRLNRAGNVLQVVSATKTDTFSTSSTSFVDVTGLSVSITPTSASSKILVLMDVKLGSSTNVSNFVKLVRNSTDIYVGDAAGNRIRATYANADDPSNQWMYQGSGVFLDSPSTTSSTTYKVQMLSEPSGNTGTVYLNRSGEDADFNEFARAASSITVMEIAA